MVHAESGWYILYINNNQFISSAKKARADFERAIIFAKKEYERSRQGRWIFEFNVTGLAL